MKLLHLSDLHRRLSTAEDQDIVISALLRDLTGLTAAHGDIDLVVFSGDLAFSGQPAEYDQTLSSFLQPLMGTLKLERKQIVLAAGNHDIDRNTIEKYSEAGLRSLLADRTAVNSLLDDPAETARSTSRLEGWRAFCATFYDQPASIQQICGLGQVHALEIDGLQIAVASLNSAWRATGGPDDVDREHLLIGDRQMTRAAQAVSSADLAIAVAHHPIDWLAPFDGEDVLRNLTRSFDFFLTGHTHLSAPVGIHRPGGSYIHSQAGSLYGDDGRKWANSYSLFDIDIPSQRVLAQVRAFVPAREEFDSAVEIASGGQFELTLPDRSRAVAQQAAKNLSMSADEFVERKEGAAEALADRIRERSVLAPSVEEEFTHSAFERASAYLVQPVFRSTPPHEAGSSVEQQDEGDDQDAVKRPARTSPMLDPSQLSSAHVLVLGAENGAGLTSALDWLLLLGTNDVGSDFLPVSIEAGAIGNGQRAVDAAVRVALANIGLSVDRAVELPDVSLAVDDVHTLSAKKAERLADFVLTHPSWHFVLGSRTEAVSRFVSMLDERSIKSSIAYLSRLGRKQIREMATLINADRSSEVTRLVEQVLTGEGLARTPFVASALVSLVAADADMMTARDETAIVDVYARYLLGDDQRFENARVGMTTRNRQHLLSAIAENMVARDSGVIASHELEQFILDYFRSVGWHEPVSSVIDDLVDRWVLYRIDETNLAFRQRNLAQYFTALRARDSETLRVTLLGRTLEFGSVLEYMAGLAKDDRGLLAHALGVVPDESELGTPLDDVKSDPMPWPQDDSEPSDPGDTPDESSVVPSEEAMDQAWDDMQAARIQSFAIANEISRLPEPAIFSLRTSVASVILRNSELVPDIAAKKLLLSKCILAWAETYRRIQSTLLPAAMEASASAEVAADLGIPAEILGATFGSFTSFLAQMITVGQVIDALSTVKLRDLVNSLLNDQVLFKDPVASALLAALAQDVGASDATDYMLRVVEAHLAVESAASICLLPIIAEYQRVDLKGPQHAKVEGAAATLMLRKYTFKDGQEQVRARESVTRGLRATRDAAHGRVSRPR